MNKEGNKYERVYEDETSIDTWKYDLSKNPNGPIEVDIKYKRYYNHPALQQTKPNTKKEKKPPTKK
jgi:hypothetical protein